jgi:hypothetical protein
VKKMSDEKPVEKKPDAAKERAKPATRRPDSGLLPSFTTIRGITTELKNIMDDIENYVVNMRALDRKRHNAVGVRRLGFIEAVYRISSNFPQYFPHWLTSAKYKRDLDLFTAIQGLVEVCRSLEEKVWNMNVEAADMAYTNALEYYSQVQDAAERRIDSAETIYAELNKFFRHGPMSGENGEGEPTESKLKADVAALIHGRRDGEITIKNLRPSMTGGSHEVIDETFRDRASFKESEQGAISE